MYIKKGNTERLSIRNLNASDIMIWENFFVDNENLKYLGLNLSLNKHEQSKNWIERQLWRYENNKFGHQALICSESGKFIGQCGLLTQEVNGEEEVEIGYHILPEYWGYGFATEAAKFFKDYAFNNNICDSLVSIIDINNIASQKVAEKNEMKIEKQIKYYDLDVYVYRVNK